MIAPNAVKGDFAARAVVKRPVSAVIIDPAKREHAEHEESVEDDLQREIRRGHHAAYFTRRDGRAKGKEKRAALSRRRVESFEVFRGA
jgi:hypothetical protein